MIASTGASPNIGAIVGGVVAGVVVVVAFIYGRRIIQFLRSRCEVNPNANDPPPGAQTQELLGSHSLPTNWASARPPPSPSIQTGTYTPATEPNPTRALPTGTNSIRAPFTTPSGPSTTTESGDIPSDPEVHRGSSVHLLGMPPSHAQGPSTASPSCGAFNVAVNHVQVQILNEPVEEGLMSREAGVYEDRPSAS